MTSKAIIKPAKSAPAVGPYNHAVRVGDRPFCAARIPIDPAHPAGPLVGDIRLGDFVVMNEAYARYFTSGFPARSTVQVAALPRGANVEIEVTTKTS